MTLRRDAVVALLLLALFLGYGLQATSIQLFPGQESEPFTPRTMPYALAICGVVLSLLQVLKSLRAPVTKRQDWRDFEWWRGTLLCLCMLAYGLFFDPLGFIPATALFLVSGFIVLGEKRLPVLVLLPLGFAIAFWAVMTRLLGLYLAPGAWVGSITG